MDITNLYDIYLQYPSVQTDTRKIKKGDLFFALKGPSFNGNSFALEALSLGAAYAIIDEASFGHNERCIVVDDVLKTLQDLASHHRKQFKVPVLAITGSNGKTTSKELVTAVLRQKFKTYATEGNLNNHIGVPLSLLKVKKDAGFIIIEMGANHQKEIASYCTIAQPNYAVINNCGKAHLEGFGGIEGVKKGKGELYDYIRANGGMIFINKDFDYLEEMAKGISQQISYGTHNAVYTGNIQSDNGMMLHIKAHTPRGHLEIQSNLVGEYNFPNLMLALSIGDYFDIPLNKIKLALEQYQPDNSRSQLILKESNQVILDAYNANPTSMQAAIDNFAKQKGVKVLWLGAMKEMGTSEAQEHEALVNKIKAGDWQSVILVGKEFKGYQGDYLWFEDAGLAAQYVALNKPQNALILIKGSRGSKMEKLFEAL